jgi:hypothetical protein
MSPKYDNREHEDKPDVLVNIPHEPEQAPLVPPTAPPLPELEPLPVRPINITDNVPAPPPAVPPIPSAMEHEFYEHKGRRWPTILAFVLLAFLVTLLVVFTGRWIYNKTTHKTSKTTAPETSNTSALPATPTPSTSTGGVTAQSTTSTSSQLPNNGPGDVAAIFVGTALAMGGLHFLYNLRKQN